MSQISPIDDNTCKVGENLTAFVGMEFTRGFGGDKIAGDTMIF